ncbi:diguanylate cyclase domain-containing protein [Rhodocyclus tenuis]|uniref:Diguanylate cyclase (GGDEF)-like protein/hemerythrin-like metal-binding protein/PAS domain S-box-containing protein n=1 Tax=Rhodocyclus tenuis TaxID=1066 RepID=A0A840G0R9_RHOTE|nr:diguanylate cyclase [Rhodocyclus tenuis]MBB4247804.1 diguanylate cyclase (GGDEF)-like protein/hemerythrin-like metal-binding protein/PAS domain S-box-containing protein [Rhodocyclus tenuis]
MTIDIMRRASLKTKVTVFTLGIFVLGIWTLSFYASRVLREDMERGLGLQQFAAVSFVARAINESLDERLRALESVAKKIPPATLADKAALQAFLDSQSVLQMLFSGGVFVTRLDGTAVAELPRSNGRIGSNFLDRETVSAALKEGRSSIGPPVIGKLQPTPVFGGAVPIRDVFGDVNGALVGVISLQNAAFLDHLTEIRYGEGGGFFLVARKERLIVTASNKDRIMRTLSPPGAVPAIDRFIDGYEGTQIYVNPFGVEVIASARRLTAVDWGVSVSIPTAEAFAPIRDMQLRLLIATVFLTLLAGVLTWWMLKRQFSPLLSTAKMLAHLSATEQTPKALPIVSEDEIGELIAGFNTLLADIAQRKNALRTSEQRLFTILESVDAFIYLKDKDGRYLFANRRVRDLFGASMEEIVGKGDEHFFSADAVAGIRANDAQVLRDGVTLRSEETSTSLESGGESTYLSVKLPLRNEAGEIYALCGISTDITARKTLEDQVRQLAFYDVLTSLPNRRLLEDRLQRAVAASRRSGALGALMFVDLDNFKPLNDRYGHELGDLLLIEVARRLLACVREVDTVARFGGDEFVLMLNQLAADPAAARAQAAGIAEKVRAAVSAPYLLKLGQTETLVEHRCTASIGVALFDGREADREGVLKRADKAMYQAKERGRNLVCFDESPLASARRGDAPGNLVQLVWHPAYESGNAVIDAQHRALIDEVNNLLAAIIAGPTHDAVAALIDALLESAARHFADEEAIIAAAGFPGAEEHAALHRQFLEGSSRLVDSFRAGKLGLGELFQYLAHEVIARHMFQADREFFKYLAERR